MIATFSGPSCRCTDLHSDYRNFGPAVCGSIVAATHMGATCVVLIDGTFGTIPTVWHKEILFALSKGVRVIGAASIGAIRAVELERFGVFGVGMVFDFYKSGVLDDDADLCVAHAPAEYAAMDYKPYTVPFVNILATMNGLIGAGQVTDDSGATCLKQLQAVPFYRRTNEAVEAELKRFSVDGELFWQTFVDAKRHDAVAAFTQAAACDYSFSAIDLGQLDIAAWAENFERTLPNTERLLIDRARQF
jgi:hypothetical protein